MRILFCNKYNYAFSGTEVYLFELMKLLRAYGHEVALFSMYSSNGDPTPYDHHFVPYIDFKANKGLWQKARSAVHAVYSTGARLRIRRLIQEFQPDVAHVRNIYHHLSPSILWELKAQNVPVLQHLNDFKLLCPSYNLVSRGESCEACKGGAFWHALRRRCYPGLGARLTLATEAYVHRWLATYKSCVDLFLAPSQFVCDKFVEHGWDRFRFDVLPHFQAAQTYEPITAGSPIIYFGRLSGEKGVDDLLRAAAQNPEIPLVIAGDGPERTKLAELAASLGLKRVEFVGHLGPEERDLLIKKSLFSVMPSHAYETFGKTILESYALGRAVIASDLGSRRELIRHGVTGLLYRPGDVTDLATAIQFLASRPDIAEKMGRAGLNLVQQSYQPEDHYRKLLGLYERVVAAKKGHYDKLVVTAGEPPWLPSRERQVALKQAVADRPHLRIAFIGGRGVVSKYSGIEAYYEEVGSRLAEMGHDVTIYCRSHFTPAVAKYQGMRILRFPTVRSKHFETLIHTGLSTAHAVTQKYDIVHYHALGPALFSFIPRFFGQKSAVTVQGLDWQRRKWGRVASAVLKIGEHASATFPTGTTVVSRVLQQRFRKAHSIEPAYVPNGGVIRDWVEPHKILEWGIEPGNYVLFLGRFSPEKGCHLLIDAFEQLDTRTQLVMAGASSYCDEYSRALRTHASNRIRLLDWVSGTTLDELLTNAMIFVLPSDLEGLSLALLDAMGAGLCVVVSDVPENREVVDGVGFTFHQGDASDLAERLRFLLANPAVREASGRMAKKRIVEKYQWQKIAKDIEAEYFNLMGFAPPSTQMRKESKPAQALDHGERVHRHAG